MSLAQLAADFGRKVSTEAGTQVADVITFIESEWGLGLRLYPIQRVILKAHYGLELDDNPLDFPLDVPVPKTHPNYQEELVDEDGFYLYRIHITDFRKENPQTFSEAGYLVHLYEEGRSNIREVVPGDERREMVLSVGRRSGKTLITSCVIAYETYKLLLLGNPQGHYGVSKSNVITLISVATGSDQASLLFSEAKGHFTDCDYFLPYTANNTQSFYTFQSPWDIERYGTYSENPKAGFSIRVTFKSCVAKGLRGGNNILVALDECAHFGEKGQASADEVYEAVEPSTRTFSPKDPRNKTRPIGENEGRIIMISSPLGKQGLFYKQFRLGFGNHEAAANLLCIQAPTWEVNPTVPAETFVGSYLKDPNVFFREFGAEFSDRSRGWIESETDLKACIIPTLRPKLRAPPRAPHFLGLDIALAGDYSALAVGHNDSEGMVTLDLIDRIRAGEGDFESYERLEFEDVADWVHDVSKRFYISEGIFDQWAGIPFEQALVRRGLKRIKTVHFTDRLSSDVFMNFKHLMYNRQLALYNWPVPREEGVDYCEYIQELLELQAEVKSKYVVKVEAPRMDGKFDDFSDALVRMAYLATQNSTERHYMTGSRNRRATGGHSSSGARFGRVPSRVGRTGSHASRQAPKKRKR